MRIRLFLGIGVLTTLFFSFRNIETSKYEAITNQNNATGKALYEELCIQCHLGTGQATKGVIPPLDGSDWFIKKRKESIHAVKYGLRGPIIVNGKKYNGSMSPMGLNDQEIADVMNYIMTSWSNKQTKKVTVDEVASVTK